MSILESVLSAASTGVVGSILGVGGAVVTKYMEQKTAKIAGDLELEKLKENNSHAKYLANLSLSAEGYKSLISSIESDKATYSVGSTSFLLILADFIKAIVRPVLTVLLICLTSGVLVYIFSTYSIKFTDAQIYAILDAILTCILNCTSMALGWWFGARSCK